jgi:beta-phosphoglucomutase-like phosphatase (HAD superfamily)
MSGYPTVPRYNIYRMNEEPHRMKLALPPGNFAAYIFDCDGTIVDSMPLHFVAWRRALGEWNCKFTEEQFYAWGGVPTDEIISRLNVEQSLRMPVEELALRKEEMYYADLPNLKPVPEVLEHILAQHGRIPFAVVSGGTRESVTKSLAATNLLDRFDTLVCAGDYVKSKPDPEPFLLAAQRLGIPPSSCLVFEDTVIGIQSATAAGMATVKVPSPHERNTHRILP